MMFEPLSVSLLPNFQKDDYLLAGQILFRPGLWQQGAAVRILERQFEADYSGYQAASFLSGRIALRELLHVFGLGKGDEIIVPAFSCVVVAGAVMGVGAQPVFADIDPLTFNVSLESVKKKFSSKTKAVVVQHTFGYPAPISQIVSWAHAKNIRVIEDCAHLCRVTYRGRLLGSFGDGAIFSFGRDKALSGVFGGLAIVRKELVICKWRRLKKPSTWFVFRQLLYPLYFRAALAVYNAGGLGKLLIWVGQRFGLLSKAVFPCEKKGFLPAVLSARFPNGLAILVLNQLAKIDHFNRHRRGCVRRYAKAFRDLPIQLPPWKDGGKKAFPLLRFTIRTPRAQGLYNFAKKRGILFSNWYYPALSPAGTKMEMVHFDPNLVPQATKVSSQVVNLPTHRNLRKEEQMKIIQAVKDFYASA